MFLNREEFLAKARAKRGTITLDGDEFYVRGMTAKEIQSYVGFEVRSEKEKSESALKQFAQCVLNEDGSQMFDPNKQEDLELISSIAFSVVNDVTKKITELSGLSAVQEAAKN